MAFLTSSLIAPVPLAFVLLAALFANLIRKIYARSLTFKNLPQPPRHPIWGHLNIMARLKVDYPQDVHPHSYPHIIREQYGLGNVYYLDLWPMGEPTLVISTPEIANQMVSQPKHRVIVEFMPPLAGNHSLVTMENQEWKTWRSIFNPGFSPTHLLTLVPGIVDDVLVFCDILEQHARKQDVFRLEEAATRLTVDVIGKVVLDTELNSQRSENVLVNAFRRQVAWLKNDQELNPFKRWNIARPVMQWWCTKQMDEYIGRALEERFSSRETGESKLLTRKKHIIDLALETYYLEEKQGVDKKRQSLDSTFKRYAMDQIKTFIFAGHDTTSSTICYVYHMLSKHPEVRAKVCREHSEVFGSDASQAAESIKSNPHLLNQLDYTVAVIKEILRLFPPASAFRAGNKSLFLHDPATGEKYPTDGFMVWLNHVAIHRNRDIWGEDANEFRPERFLSSRSEAIPKDAWRPFEKGPRACVGQELALIETKVILVMTLRRFDITATYHDLEKVVNDGLGWPADEGGKRTALGDEAYQILRATAKPRQGMPVRVSMRT